MKNFLLMLITICVTMVSCSDSEIENISHEVKLEEGAIANVLSNSFSKLTEYNSFADVNNQIESEFNNLGIESQPLPNNYLVHSKKSYEDFIKNNSKDSEFILEITSKLEGAIDARTQEEFIFLLENINTSINTSNFEFKSELLELTNFLQKGFKVGIRAGSRDGIPDTGSGRIFKASVRGFFTGLVGGALTAGPLGAAVGAAGGMIGGAWGQFAVEIISE